MVNYCIFQLTLFDQEGIASGFSSHHCRYYVNSKSRKLKIGKLSKISSIESVIETRLYKPKD